MLLHESSKIRNDTGRSGGALAPLGYSKALGRKAVKAAIGEA